MEAVAEGHTIVLVGGWNRQIFSPQWVAEHVSHTDEVKLEIALTNPGLPLRLSFGDHLLSIGTDRIVLGSRNPTDENLDRLAEFANSILELLPHTPLSALGINVRWRETEPSADIVSMFVLDDNDRLADAGATIRETTIRRTLLYDNRTLNLSLTFSDAGHLIADCNFHWDVTDAASARGFIEEGVAHLRARSRELLGQLYELQQA